DHVLRGRDVVARVVLGDLVQAEGLHPVLRRRELEPGAHASIIADAAGRPVAEKASSGTDQPALWPTSPAVNIRRSTVVNASVCAVVMSRKWRTPTRCSGMSQRSSSAVIQARRSKRDRSTGTEYLRSVFSRRRLK